MTHSPVLQAIFRRPLQLLLTALLVGLHSIALPALAEERRTAVFAAGCFWCVEAEYEKLDGVLSAVSGFTGGAIENPTYKGDHSGHYEAVEIVYDAKIVSYEQLLHLYWRNVDPFDATGQFCDRGPSYRAAIFVANSQQRKLAEASKAATGEQLAQRFPQQAIVTPVLDASRFWPVEEYHQDYYRKRPLRYRFYRSRCGRDQRLAELWPEGK